MQALDALPVKGYSFIRNKMDTFHNYSFTINEANHCLKYVKELLKNFSRKRKCFKKNLSKFIVLQKFHLERVVGLKTAKFSKSNLL